ncbi:hypothetical protein Poli38472_014169 [Pythium oligandrum]|uniref:Cold shock domain-containing protein E1 n=1 Tax=Pythium oligandrum TaxID=41045 RepID=A0A8K1FLP7_PYTOL|nr:hypothetical protein Poli38472_014169 [Pythium oligandrum]|eukprot:TMW64052.1 hypothetical protein Poli38472_014169 [Pythium oligandrum]
MFRPAQPGDWAADDDDELDAKPVAPAAAAPRQNAWQTPPAAASPQRTNDAPAKNRWEQYRNAEGGLRRDSREENVGGRDGGRDYGGRDGGRDYGGRDGGRDYGGRDGGRDYGGRDGGRDYGGRDSGRDYGRDGGRDYGRRDSGRDSGYVDRGDFHRDRDAFPPLRGSGGGYSRGGDRREAPPPMPTERGVVVSVRDNFGFVSCVDREGDIFFHMSEAPVDVELQDEVEFKVKYNQRSQKDIAVQLVRLPKGSIVWEDIAEEFVEGTVTKGIPRGNSYHNSSSSRDETHGLIEVRRPEDAKSGEESGETLKRREVVRYTATSVASGDAEGENKKPVPHFGDEVRFRIATHRKSGQKRAVELTVTQSAKDKLEKEIDAKLQSMTREQGVVARVKSGGGFIRCCARQDDVYFPFHEIRESIGTETEKKSKLTLRESDEVSFYVYEEKDEEAGARSRGRLTALRVVKLPAGTVSFEDLIRSDVNGVVTKTPKEPRTGPEVLGVINPTDDDVVAEIPSESPKGKSGLKKKKTGVSFRLSDAQDASYIPAVGDVVVFDQVMDKRSNRIKASNVRVTQLNPKNRETGVITAMKEEFGFIRCAERSGDAYFRFADVMSVSNDFRIGTEVAFDVTVDGNKGNDNIRATRIQLLPNGSVQWETLLQSDVQAELIALPSRPQHKQSANGGRGGKPLKAHNGRLRVTLGQGEHLVDHFPVFKTQLHDVFIASSNEKTEEKTEDAEKKPLEIMFPSSLTKYERAAIHAYCDWLGLTHESSGEGSNRALTVRADAKITAAALEDLSKREDARESTDLEFRAEDVADVRYNPRLGDRVQCRLVLMKRNKQLLAQHIVLVEAAPSKAKATAKTDKDAATTGLPTSEGFIVTVKPEGFGFIEPAEGGENLFFHMKEIVTGQLQGEVKEGMEVRFQVSFDEKRKKSRASHISILPAGTVTKVERAVLRGVVRRPSVLSRLKKGARFNKNDKSKQMSSVGQIRLVDATEADAAEEEEDDEDDEEDADEEETEEGEEKAEEKKEEEAKKTETKPAKPQKKAMTTYAYHISDISDLTVVLREGDEVEFVAQASTKGLRAGKIRLIQSHSQQGVVTRVLDDLSGFIRVDGEEAQEIPYTARQVLRGDLLQEGDRVEFAISKRVVNGPKAKKTKAKKAEDETKTEEATAETEAEEKPAETTTATETSGIVATSVLRLSSSSDKKSAAAAASRPGARTVNSSLLQAMRQVGATAVVSSRMAKGPDGSRGFKEGWRTAL